MTLTVSYGLDGTTGQSTYKERFNEPEPKCLDRFLFVATIIPLQMSDESRQWSAAAYLVSIGKCSAHPLLAHV